MLCSEAGVKNEPQRPRLTNKPWLPCLTASRPTPHTHEPHPDRFILPFIHCFPEKNKPLSSRKKWAARQQCAAHTGEEVLGGSILQQERGAGFPCRLALGKFKPFPSSQNKVFPSSTEP